MQDYRLRLLRDTFPLAFLSWVILQKESRREQGDYPYGGC